MTLFLNVFHAFITYVLLWMSSSSLQLLHWLSSMLQISSSTVSTDIHHFWVDLVDFGNFCNFNTCLFFWYSFLVNPFIPASLLFIFASLSWHRIYGHFDVFLFCLHFLHHRHQIWFQTVKHTPNWSTNPACRHSSSFIHGCVPGYFKRWIRKFIYSLIKSYLRFYSQVSWLFYFCRFLELLLQITCSFLRKLDLLNPPFKEASIASTTVNT